MNIRSILISALQWGAMILSPLLTLFFVPSAISRGRSKELVNTASSTLPANCMQASQLLDPDNPNYWLFDRGFSVDRVGSHQADFRIMHDVMLEKPMIVSVTDRREGQHVRMRTVNEDQTPIGAFSESLSHYVFEDLGPNCRVTATETSVFATDMSVWGRAYHHFMMWLAVKLDLMRIADQANKKFSF